MKLGLIYCAYNTENLVRPSLVPWMDARRAKLGGHEWIIVAVSVPFERFEPAARDGTQAILQDLHGQGQIDHVITTEQPMLETEARGRALKLLVELGADASWQADSDEMPTVEQIGRIVAFVSRSPATWFRLSLKNYVFNDRTYLVDPFTPARIHRLRPPGYVADGCWDDNNVEYTGAEGQIRRDVTWPHVTVPKSVAWIQHLTWLNDQRSRKKCEYQTSRGWISSYRWDYEANRLEWNQSYFATCGLPCPPETRTD